MAATPFPLRALLYSRGYTHQIMADALGCDRTLVGKVLSGVGTSAPFIKAAAELLNVTPEHLLSMIPKDRKAA